jgi:hypothetical protein
MTKCYSLVVVAAVVCYIDDVSFSYFDIDDLVVQHVVLC